MLDVIDISPTTQSVAASTLTAPPEWGLYVHWPFCATKCPYCDFNSHVRDEIDQTAWRDALVREVESAAARAGAPKLKSIFFGGGTPSLMPAQTVAAVIEAAQRYFQVLPDIEISLEANPSSVEAQTFGDLNAAGINRISLGIQSFDDAALTFLGRPHSAHEAAQAIEAAQKAVERVSFDLIYALPDQTLADWRKQLNLALAFGTDHISAYQLTIEPNTGFYSQVARGVFTPLDDDVAADLFDYTSERLGAAGLTAYETSNHARAQAQCQHNLVYWRGLPYAAVGPGAHGRWRDGKHRWTATANIKKPERWLQQVMADAHGIEVDVALSARDRAEEIVLTSLRLSEGLDIEAASALAGFRVSELMDRDALGQLQRGGWLVVSNGIVRLTPKAQPVANHIVNQLFT